MNCKYVFIVLLSIGLAYFVCIRIVNVYFCRQVRILPEMVFFILSENRYYIDLVGLFKTDFFSSPIKTELSRFSPNAMSCIQLPGAFLEGM